MKYAYALIAALLLVGASALPLGLSDDIGKPNKLDLDLIEFFDRIPKEEFLKVGHEHASDPELFKVIQYLLSDEFHKLVYAVEDLQEFNKYVLFLHDAGYNAMRELRLTHKSLGMKDYVPPKQTEEFMENMKKGGGLNGYMDDIYAILPRKELKELHAKKLKESSAFAKFVAALKSPEFAKIRADLYAQEPMQNFLREANAHGFDFQKYYDFRYTLFGFD